MASSAINNLKQKIQEIKFQDMERTIQNTIDQTFGEKLQED